MHEKFAMHSNSICYEKNRWQIKVCVWSWKGERGIGWNEMGKNIQRRDKQWDR